MKVAMTIPISGAGKFAWTGWSNAFKALGHEAINLNNYGGCNDVHYMDIDLLICSTSSPNSNFIEWRKNNPSKKVALNVLAWTDYKLPGINNPGVQATPGNIDYARDLKPNIVFAQYSKPYAQLLLEKWAQKGYKLGSMAMAADSTVYTAYNDKERYLGPKPYELFYAGGYWPYKAQNIDKFLLPVLQKYKSRSLIVGKGWPLPTAQIENEGMIGYHMHAAKVCPNIHEPHSTLGGYDVVERVFKVMYCGGILVTDYVAELFDMGFRDGIHGIACTTASEYANVIDELMNDRSFKLDDEMSRMRKEAHEFAASKHTYIHRVQTLLGDLNE